ncbi:hypothetical protein ScPMuIL_005282 [Solemya velum]
MTAQDDELHAVMNVIKSSDLVYWPGINKQIADTISRCSPCQEGRNSQQREPLIPTSIPSRPWEHVAEDLFDCLGHKWLICVDYYLEYFEIEKLVATDSDEIIRLSKKWFSVHGIPEKVTSDNGPPWNGDLLLKKCQESGDDPYLALLNIRDTPRDEHTGSPSQRLFSRRTATTLPTANTKLLPEVRPIIQVRQQLTHDRHHKAKKYYDEHVKPLQPLSERDTIRVRQGKTWQPARLLPQSETLPPRSYNIQLPSGRHTRRNRRDLLKTFESDIYNKCTEEKEDELECVYEEPPIVELPSPQDTSDRSVNELHSSTKHLMERVNSSVKPMKAKPQYMPAQKFVHSEIKASKIKPDIMPRGPSRHEDSGDEMGEESQLESELSRYQRQLRVMEGDRRAYAEESCNIIRKQQHEIENLLSENTEIRTVLRLAQSEKNEGMDEESTTKLRALIAKLDAYKKQVEEEENKIKDLDNEIAKAEMEICEQRKKTGEKTEANTEKAIQKKLMVMENRLDKAMVKFNNQLSVNATLRQEIDHLRQERAVFDSLYRKLSRALEINKDEMNDIISQASEAYEERDEAQNKMMALKDRSEKDIAQHDLEMKDLQRVINHDNKLKEFMMVKAHDRAEYKEEEEAKKRKVSSDKDSDVEKQQIDTYEEAFRLIKESTGEEDITKIVNDFIQREGENFAMYNFVNELNDEVERLQEELSVLRTDIHVFQEEDVKLEEDRKSMLREFEIRSEKACQDAEDAEKKTVEMNKVLDEMREGVKSLFVTVDCDASAINDMLASEDGVTDRNILQYMGIIEQKTMELLQIQQFIHMKKQEPVAEKKDKKEVVAAAAATNKVYRTTVPAPLTIAAPSTGDDDVIEVQEDSDKPLSREELKLLVMRNLSRKTGSNNSSQMSAHDTKQRSKSPRTP